MLDSRSSAVLCGLLASDQLILAQEPGLPCPSLAPEHEGRP